MKRALLLLACLLFLTGVGAAQETPDECTGNATNASLQDLCDRLESAQESNNELEQNNTELTGEIATLRYEVNNTQSVRGLAEEMGFIWGEDPDSGDGEPKTLILRNEEDSINTSLQSNNAILFQRCNPAAVGAEGFDLNNDGEKEYCEVTYQEARTSKGFPTYKFDLHYSEPGMNSTFKARTEGELKAVAEELNDQGGIAAYSRWESQKLQSTIQQSNLGNLGMTGTGVVVALIVGIIARPIIDKKQEAARVEKSHRTGHRSPNDRGLLDRIKGLFNQ
ncbi:hypothetical protein [Haloarcula rara]|uniref:hypothetical protein n=1 Tax=Haloarcula rara TaxID=3033387 RepID=UPI0023E88285|nr:hypothetical protein [Halomicroarcula sp. SHR3]